MLSELPENPGTSVTNCYEQLATDLLPRILLFVGGYSPERITWIEHYIREKKGGLRESWDLVSLDWDGKRFFRPRWKHLTDEQAFQIIGGPIQIPSNPLEQAVADQDLKKLLEEIWPRYQEAAAEALRRSNESLKMTLEEIDEVYKQVSDGEWQVMVRFRKFADTITDKDKKDFFHPMNRSEYLRSFAAWLADYVRTEPASND